MSAQTDATAISSSIAKKIDGKKLIEIIPNRNPAQIQAICDWYKSMNNSELPADLEKNVSGEFGHCLSSLCKSPVEYDIELIQEATSGMRIKEGVLFEVLIRKTNHDMQMLIQTYKTKFNKDLEALIKEKTSGYLQQLFLVLLQANRDETNTVHSAADDVVALYNAGQGKFGTDKNAFINLFATRSDGHLRKVFTQYEQDYKKSIDKVISSEIFFTGGLELAMISIYKIVQNAPEYVAEIIESSMTGAGTNERRLSRALIRYRGTFAEHVKAAYEKLYKRPLKDRLMSETSGDYRALLLCLIYERAA